MRLIDIDTIEPEVLYEEDYDYDYDENPIENYQPVEAVRLSEIKNAPTINAEPVVRCGECKHARESEEEFDWDGTPLYRCGYCKLPNRRHEYCSWGERRKE